MEKKKIVIWAKTNGYLIEEDPIPYKQLADAYRTVRQRFYGHDIVLKKLT